MPLRHPFLRALPKEGRFTRTPRNALARLWRRLSVRDMEFPNCFTRAHYVEPLRGREFFVALEARTDQNDICLVEFQERPG
jgi:hypothetical protein